MMEIQASEPLLDNDGDVRPIEAAEPKQNARIEVNSHPTDRTANLRNVNVEPVLVLYFLAFVPSRMLIDQFLYTMISEEHNVTSIVRLEHNETHCTVNKSDTHFIEHEIIQDEASRWAMYLKFVQCIPSMVNALVCGTISDRVSRKLPIILPLFANIVQIGLCVLMVILKLPKSYLFLAYGIDGLSGSYVTLLMGCFAYTGNATKHSSRSLRIAINELCIGIAISLSDVGIGYMIKQFGFLYPFIAILGIQFINILYALFFLQETLVSSFSINMISCRQLFEPFRIYFKDRPDNKRWKLVMIQFIFWCYAFGSIGRGSVGTLYLQNVPFCFNAKLLGYYIAVSAVVFGLGNIIPVAVTKNRDYDIPLLIASTISACASMILLGLSVTTFMLYTGNYTIPCLSPPYALFVCLYFTSHRQRGHLETAPPFTVPCEGREARFLHRSHRESNPGPSRGSPLF